MRRDWKMTREAVEERKQHVARLLRTNQDLTTTVIALRANCGAELVRIVKREMEQGLR